MDSATSTTAIVFAQITVEAPKNGAISRAAAISAPSELKPTASTSASSGARNRGRTPDVVTGKEVVRSIAGWSEPGSLVERREVDLAGAAHRAVPVVGNVLERG